MANQTGKAEKAKTTKRAYESALRAEQALETRRRVRDAADRLFLRDGYQATSMSGVAEEAGVSRQTVFSAFGSKANLLKEVVDVRIVGDDAPLSVDDRRHAAVMLGSEDPVLIIRTMANLSRSIAEGVLPMSRIVMEAAAVEPEIAAMVAAMDAGRWQGVAHLPRRLAELGALTPRWTVDQATDAVWLINGASAGIPAIDRGWTFDDYERWMFESMIGLLLDGVEIPPYEPFEWPEGYEDAPA
jgi:AcrR family transcriptional regulator